MTVQVLNSLALVLSLGLMLAQLGVREKRGVHLLFAVFCGSIAMLMASRLAAGSPGPYQYLFGLGACATCNGYWLVARSLFRGAGAISLRHVAVAGTVGLLLISDQGMQALHASGLLQGETLPAQVALDEALGLLSSALLVLAFGEACRGWRGANRADRLQRAVFMLGYGGSVLTCTVGYRALQSAGSDGLSPGVLAAVCALIMLVLTQVLIQLRFPRVAVQATPGSEPESPVPEVGASAAPVVEAAAPEISFPETVFPETAFPEITFPEISASQISASQISAAEQSPPSTNPSAAAGARELSAAEHVLAGAVQAALRDERLYLQPELKLADLARRFGVSEYRISRVIRLALGGRNFNQFVNHLRVQHACELLTSADTQHWPVLVIGLESGFASVGPFTRAFKAETGLAPGEFRARLRAADEVRICLQ